MSGWPVLQGQLKTTLLLVKQYFASHQKPSRCRSCLVVQFVHNPLIIICKCPALFLEQLVLIDSVQIIIEISRQLTHQVCTTNHAYAGCNCRRTASGTGYGIYLGISNERECLPAVYVWNNLQKVGHLLQNIGTHKPNIDACCWLFYMPRPGAGFSILGDGFWPPAMFDFRTGICPNI